MSFWCPESVGLQSFLFENVTAANNCYKEKTFGKIENLLNWQIGYLSPKVEIKNGNFDLGIFANDQIEQNEILLLIQNQHLITIENAFTVKIRT